MNTTPDPHPTNAEPGAGAPKGGSGSGFFTWLRGLGITRGDDRWFAGVAGGIAHRLRIDPLIVRGAFVVLALIGGSAVLIYLAGWLLLPDKFGRIHLEEMLRGRARAGVIVAVVFIAAILLTPVVFGGGSPLGMSNLLAITPFGFPGWLSATLAWLAWIAVIVGLGIWLPRMLRNRRNGDGEAHPHGPSGAPGAPGASGGAWATSQATGAPGTPGTPGAPAGTAPTAPAAPAGDAPSAHFAPPAPPTGAAPAASAEPASGDPTTTWAAPTAGSPDPGVEAPTAPTIPLDPDTAAYGAGQAGPTSQGGPTGPSVDAGSARPGEPGGWSMGNPEDFGRRASEWGRRTGEQATEWGHRAGQRAEAWAENAEKRSKDWDARHSAEYEARKAGPAFTLVSLAAALLIAGATSAIAMVNGLTGTELLLPGLIAGLATLALALIVAGIMGSRTGWVGFLATCGVIALTLAAILPAGSNFQAFGNVTATGSEPGVLSVAGNMKLDLSGDEHLGGGTGEAHNTFTATLVAGNLTVELPSDRPAVVQVRVLAGGIKDDVSGSGTTRTAGPFVGRTIIAGGANAAHPTSNTLVVTVYVVAGNVTVDQAGSGSLSGTTATSTAGANTTVNAATHLQLDSENAR